MSEKPFQMEKVSLEAVMVEVLGRMKPSVEKNGIRLKSEMAPGTPLLLADQESMKTALSNLMDNAVKFSPSGGRVEVSIKPEGGGVRIRLTNTSDPIPEDDLKRLFDPFYRGENSRGKTEGTGLGLAVTKRIVEGHGGTIEAKNVGWGLQLSVYLPATQQLANRY
jgi:signal transduction histidine kinase